MSSLNSKRKKKKNKQTEKERPLDLRLVRFIVFNFL